MEINSDVLDAKMVKFAVPIKKDKQTKSLKYQTFAFLFPLPLNSKHEKALNTLIEVNESARRSALKDSAVDPCATGFRT